MYVLIEELVFRYVPAIYLEVGPVPVLILVGLAGLIATEWGSWRGYR